MKTSLIVVNTFYWNLVVEVEGELVLNSYVIDEESRHGLANHFLVTFTLLKLHNITLQNSKIEN